MLTYPLQPSTIIQNATVGQVLAFLKSPALLARRLSEIIGAENFLAHVLLTQRYAIQGGVLAYFQDESVLSSESPEKVAPGSDYPELSLSEDQVKMLAAGKTGFGTKVTDEAVGRGLFDPLERALGLLTNTLVADFDTKSISLIQSTVTQTVTGGAWTGGDQIVADVEMAKSTIIGQKRGFLATAAVLNEPQYAKAMPKLLSLLPRESGNPLVEGQFPNVMGLTWLHSPFLPANWVPTIVDTTNFGGIGHENVPSPGYAAISTIIPNDASNIEVARIRDDDSDSTRIQVRKCDVPVVRNPSAAVEITGTGL